MVAAAITAYRNDKPNPQYYAELMVRKAAESGRCELPADEEPLHDSWADQT